MARKRKVDIISCTCKNDRTGTGPGAMFKANATDCICQLFKKGKSVDLKVGAATIAIG